MKANRFREVIAGGRMPVGHMIFEFGTRGVAKIVEAAGADFVIIDMEHTGFDTPQIADLIAWFKATTVAPFVRIPQPDYHFIARVLDAGALGIMIADVRTPEVAREAVSCAKYAPKGRRGVGLGLAHTDYVLPNAAEYFQRANDSTVVICMIESPEGVDNADAIAAVDGVDALWVGHFDLTNAMGIPAQFDHPRFHEALDRVSAAAKRHNRRMGATPRSVEQAKAWMAYGFDTFAHGLDVSVYRDALTAGIAGLRQM